MIPISAEIYNKAINGDHDFILKNIKQISIKLKEKIYLDFLSKNHYSTNHAMCLVHLKLENKKWFNYLIAYTIHTSDKFLINKLCKNTKRRVFSFPNSKFVFEIPSNMKISTEMFNMALLNLNKKQCKMFLSRNPIAFNTLTYFYAAQTKKSCLLVPMKKISQDEFDKFIISGCCIKKVIFCLKQNPNLNVKNGIYFCIENNNYPLFKYLINFDKTDKINYLNYSIKYNNYKFFRDLYDLISPMNKGFKVLAIISQAINFKAYLILSYLLDEHVILKPESDELVCQAIDQNDVESVKIFMNKFGISPNIFLKGCKKDQILYFYLKNKDKLVFDLAFNYERHGFWIFNYSFQKEENTNYLILRAIKEATLNYNSLAAAILSQHVAIENCTLCDQIHHH